MSFPLGNLGLSSPTLAAPSDLPLLLACSNNMRLRSSERGSTIWMSTIPWNSISILGAVCLVHLPPFGLARPTLAVLKNWNRPDHIHCQHFLTLGKLSSVRMHPELLVTLPDGLSVARDLEVADDMIKRVSRLGLW